VLKRINNLEKKLYCALIAKEKKVGRKIINYSSFFLKELFRKFVEGYVGP
jgi:hypothetical protein